MTGTKPGTRKDSPSKGFGLSTWTFFVLLVLQSGLYAFYHPSHSSDVGQDLAGVRSTRIATSSVQSQDDPTTLIGYNQQAMQRTSGTDNSTDATKPGTPEKVQVLTELARTLERSRHDAKGGVTVGTGQHELLVNRVYDPVHNPTQLCSNGTLKDATPFEGMRDHVYCPGSKGYLRGISIFNVAAAQHRLPLLVVKPDVPNHVSVAFQVARTIGVQVTMRAGGHNPAGRSLTSGGILIDQSLRVEVAVVDPSHGGWDFDNEAESLEKYGQPPYVRVAAGVTHKELYDVIGGTKYLAVAGSCPSVGVVGVNLAGGVGWLSRHHGLGTDNVLELDLILPNGSFVTASEHENQDLYWALRGAGGNNFGAVWEMRLRVFRQYARYMAGTVKLPVDKGETGVLQNMFDIYADVVDMTRNHTEYMIYLMLGIVSHRPDQVGVEIMFFCNLPEEQCLHQSQQLGILDRLASMYQIGLAASTTARARQKEQLLTTIRDGSAFSRGLDFVSWTRRFNANGGAIDWRSGFVRHNEHRVFLRNLAVTIGRVQLPPYKEVGLYEWMVEHIGGAMDSTMDKFDNAWPHRGSDFMASVYVVHAQKRFIQMVVDGDEMHSTDEHQASPFTMTASEAAIRTTRKNIHRFAADNGIVNASYFEMRPYMTNGAYHGYANEMQENWEQEYYGDHWKRVIEIKSRVEGAMDILCSRETHQACPSDALQEASKSWNPVFYSDRALDNQVLRLDYQFGSSSSPRARMSYAPTASRGKGPTPLALKMDSEEERCRARMVNPSNALSGGAMAAQHQAGSAVLVVGGSEGIGLAYVERMRMASYIMVGGRDRQKCASNTASMTPGPACAKLDLSSVQSIVSFVKKAQRNKDMDTLGFQCFSTIAIFAAAPLGSSRKISGSDVDYMLMVNHLGPMLLWESLFSHGILCTNARILLASSGLALAASPSLVDHALESPTYGAIGELLVDGGSAGPTLQAIADRSILGHPATRVTQDIEMYIATKMMNAMMAYEGALRHSVAQDKEPGIALFALAPDVSVNTSLSKDFLAWSEKLGNPIELGSSSDAARPYVVASTALDSTSSGSFLKGCAISSESLRRHAAGKAAMASSCEVWNKSVALLDGLLASADLLHERPNWPTRSCT